MTRYYFLSPVMGGPAAPRYPVLDLRQTIGRSDEAEIALLEPTVSRRHASIQIEDNEVWLEDLDSKHGTFVNSKRISRHRLKVGDLIIIGLSIVLRLEESEVEVPPAMPFRLESQRISGFNTRHTTELAAGPKSRDSGLVRSETDLHWTVEAKQRQTQELRRIKEDLLRARKLAGIGAFLISQRPLLEEQLEAIHRMAEEQHPATLHLSPCEQLLSTLLQVADPGLCPSLEPVALGPAIQQAAELLKNTQDGAAPHLAVDLASDLRVQADPGLLSGALAQILSSARLASQPGTPLRLHAEVKDSQVLILITAQGDHVPEEVLSGLFNPFLTSGHHFMHFGLGLFEARQIIMSFGGSLSLENNGGTLFKVLLPHAP